MKQTIFTTSLLSYGAALLLFSASPGFAQAQAANQIAPQAAPQPALATPEIKVLRELHGVKLDMPRAAVNDLLGKPKQTTKTQDEFKLEGGDLLTVRYGPQGKVRVIQFYGTDAKRAPAWADVTGDAPIQTKPNGSKYARQIVNAERFWVTMFQSKSGALTTITLSRQAN